MKSKPILFSGEMVRAILEGRKTQTRRVCERPVSTSQNHLTHDPMVLYKSAWLKPKEWSPYGKPGDQLWVRETFVLERWEDEPAFAADKPTQYYPGDGTEFDEPYWLRPHYRATDPAPDLCDEEDNDPQCKWRPSIFMPRWVSRLTLEIVNIRVERLQDITKDDAKAEGVSNVWSWDAERNNKHPEHFRRALLNPYVANYSVLWDELNFKRGFGWNLNPWVWIIEFKKVETTNAN